MATKKTKPTIGWREWLSLPDFAVSKIKVKIDTGARTSSLHVTNLKNRKYKNKEFVYFNVHPDQDSAKPSIPCRAELIEYRKVKSSNGHTSLRPVISTTFSFGELSWVGELTLVNRDLMGFRMLLGREALRNHYIIDPAKSYLMGKAPLKKRNRK